MAAKKKTGKVYGSKTQFVMSLPHEVSAKDVVARAKAKGLALTEAHVYKIRSTNKSKAAGGKAAAKGGKAAAKKAAPAKKAAKKAAGKAAGPDKRAFVLSMGNAPAAEVLKKAKKAGVALSKAYLYTIRAEGGAKKAAKKATKKAAKKAAKKKR